MSKKLPDLTMDDWMEAEHAMRLERFENRPKDSITAEDYAKTRGCCPTHAAKILKNLVQNGRATRRKWYNGDSGVRYVYQLKKTKP